MGGCSTPTCGEQVGNIMKIFTAADNLTWYIPVGCTATNIQAANLETATRDEYGQLSALELYSDAAYDPDTYVLVTEHSFSDNNPIPIVIKELAYNQVLLAQVNSHMYRVLPVERGDHTTYFIVPTNDWCHKTITENPYFMSCEAIVDTLAIKSLGSCTLTPTTCDPLPIRSFSASPCNRDLPILEDACLKAFIHRVVMGLATRSLGLRSCVNKCSAVTRCSIKIVKQLCASGNLDLAANLACAFGPTDFPPEEIGAALETLEDARCLGRILGRMACICNSRFDLIESYGLAGLLETPDDFDFGSSIVQGLLEETMTLERCNEFCRELGITCQAVRTIFAQIPGLIGQTLCKMVVDRASIECICTILACLNDYGFEDQFSTEVCSFFACLKMEPNITATGSSAVLAQMLLAIAQNQYETACKEVATHLFAVLCDTNACGTDYSAVITDAIQMAVDNPTITDKSGFYATMTNLLS